MSREDLELAIQQGDIKGLNSFLDRLRSSTTTMKISALPPILEGGVSTVGTSHPLTLALTPPPPPTTSLPESPRFNLFTRPLEFA